MEQQGEKPIVNVNEYERSNGVKVSEHQRQRPAATHAKEERQQQQQQKQEQKTESKKPNNNKDAGEGGGGGEEEPEQKKPKVRPMTTTEFLELDLQNMQKAIIDNAVKDDPVKANLVLQDAQKQGDKAPEHDATQFQKMVAKSEAEMPKKPTSKDFIALLYSESEKNPNNNELRSVIAHMEKGRYKEGGEFGPRTLVPHMHSTGLFGLTNRLIRCEFDMEN